MGLMEGIDIRYLLRSLGPQYDRIYFDALWRTRKRGKKRRVTALAGVDANVVLNCIEAIYREQNDFARARAISLCINYLQECKSRINCESVLDCSTVKILCLLARIPVNSCEKKRSLNPLLRKILAADEITKNASKEINLDNDMKMVAVLCPVKSVATAKSGRVKVKPVEFIWSFKEDKISNKSFRYVMCAAADIESVDGVDWPVVDAPTDQFSVFRTLPCIRSLDVVWGMTDDRQDRVKTNFSTDHAHHDISLFGALARPRRISSSIKQKLQFPKLVEQRGSFALDPLSMVLGAEGNRQFLVPYKNESKDTSDSLVAQPSVLELSNKVSDSKWLLANSNSQPDIIGNHTVRVLPSRHILGWEEHVKHSFLYRTLSSGENLDIESELISQYLEYAMLGSERGPKQFERHMQRKNLLRREVSECTDFVHSALLAVVGIPTKFFLLNKELGYRSAINAKTDLCFLCNPIPSIHIEGLSDETISCICSEVRRCGNTYLQLCWLIDSPDSPLAKTDVGPTLIGRLSRFLLEFQKDVTKFRELFSLEFLDDNRRVLKLLRGIRTFQNRCIAVLSVFSPFICDENTSPFVPGRATCSNLGDSFGSLDVIANIYEVVISSGKQVGLERELLDAAISCLTIKLGDWLLRCVDDIHFENSDFLCMGEQANSGSNVEWLRNATENGILVTGVQGNKSQFLKLPEFFRSSAQGYNSDYVADRILHAGNLLRVMRRVPEARLLFEYLTVDNFQDDKISGTILYLERSAHDESIEMPSISTVMRMNRLSAARSDQAYAKIVLLCNVFEIDGDTALAKKTSCDAPYSIARVSSTRHDELDDTISVLNKGVDEKAVAIQPLHYEKKSMIAAIGAVSVEKTKQFCKEAKNKSTQTTEFDRSCLAIFRECSEDPKEPTSASTSFTEHSRSKNACPIDVAIQAGFVEPMLRQCRLIEHAFLLTLLFRSDLKFHLDQIRQVLLLGNGSISVNIVESFHKVYEKISLFGLHGEEFSQQQINRIFSEIPSLATEGSLNALSHKHKLRYSVEDKEVLNTRGIESFATLSFLKVSFALNWPLTALVTREDLELYTKIHKFLISIKFCHSLAKRMWSSVVIFRKHDTDKTVLSSWLSWRWHQVRHILMSVEEYLLSMLMHDSWMKIVDELLSVRCFAPKESHKPMTSSDLKDARPYIYLCRAHAKFLKMAKCCCFLEENSASRNIHDCITRLSLTTMHFFEASKNSLAQGQQDPDMRLEAAWQNFSRTWHFLLETLQAFIRSGRAPVTISMLLLHVDFNNYFSNSGASHG